MGFEKVEEVLPSASAKWVVHVNVKLVEYAVFIPAGKQRSK